MDRLVDEAEGLAVDSSSSVCSGAGGGGRMEATTEQQLSLLNSITASDLTGLCGNNVKFFIADDFLTCPIYFLSSLDFSC